MKAGTARRMKRIFFVGADLSVRPWFACLLRLANLKPLLNKSHSL